MHGFSLYTPSPTVLTQTHTQPPVTCCSVAASACPVKPTKHNWGRLQSHSLWINNTAPQTSKTHAHTRAHLSLCHEYRPRVLQSHQCSCFLSKMEQQAKLVNVTNTQARLSALSPLLIFVKGSTCEQCGKSFGSKIKDAFKNNVEIRVPSTPCWRHDAE